MSRACRVLLSLLLGTVLFALWSMECEHVLLDGVRGVVFGVLGGGDDTVFAAGYTEDAFRRLRVGMTEHEVTDLVGRPPESVRMKREAGGQRWLYRVGGATASGWSYSKSQQSVDYRIRIVVFENGHVVDTVSEFYID